MGGIFVQDGKEVLYAIPSPPANFYNVSGDEVSGVYIMGQDKFRVKEFHIVGILRRSVGPTEEFLLGVLSVFLIAVLSEIVHVFLMRTSQDRRLSPSSVIYACLVDELSHFRNIWSHLSAVRQRRGGDTRSLTARQRFLASLVVISISLALFAAEVVAVVLTQPIMVSSEKYQYNIKAVQPVGTTRGIARFIRRVAGDRICVSPILTRATQSRNFIVSACSLLKTERRLFEADDVSDEIEVGSWYHSGGSDYNVTFGDTYFHLRLRAELLLDSNKGGSRRVSFENLDDDEMNHARYIQERFIYSSMEWVCNKKDITTKTCQELVNELKVVGRKQEVKKIVLWRGKKDFATENVTGLVTTFKVGMNAPWEAMNSGIRELYASAALLEVEGQSRYTNVHTDEIENGIPGLISEEGRVAGVWALLIVFGILLVVLTAIRRVFKPISIAHMAMRHVGDDTDFGTEDRGEVTEISEYSFDPSWREPRDLQQYSNTNPITHLAQEPRVRGTVSRTDNSFSTWESEDV